MTVLMTDANFASDRMVRRVLAVHGPFGYGVIKYAIEQMRLSKSHAIVTCDIKLFAQELYCADKNDEILDVIETAVSVGLFERDGNSYTYPPLISELQAFETKKKNWRARQSTSRKKRRNVTCDISVTEVVTDLNVTGDDEKENKNENKKENENKELELIIDQSIDKESEAATPEIVPPPNPKKSKHKPKFDPTGKTKYLDWVYLSPEQYARVRAYYEARGLGLDEFEEAVRALDEWFANNPQKRMERTDDAKALTGWPLSEALKRRRELMNSLLAENRLKKFGG